MNLYSHMVLQPMILGSRRPIHCRYAGALPSSKQKLITLHGKWCYTRTERALAEYGMIELCAQADIYKGRMDFFLGQKNADADPDGDSKDQKLPALVNAEWTFAEQCFLELSRQASAYELRLRKINAALNLLSLERDQLYLQMDAEMRAGQFAQGVQKGGSSQRMSSFNVWVALNKTQITISVSTQSHVGLVPRARCLTLGRSP